MSLPSQLLQQINTIVGERDLPSRSQWIAELIQNELARHGAATRPDEMLAGTVTLVYRGDMERVRHELADRQSGFLKEVISSQHIFLEDDQSLEVLIVQGRARRLRELSDAIRKVRGVQQVRLTTTKALLPPLHEWPRASGGETGGRTAVPRVNVKPKDSAIGRADAGMSG